MTELVVDWCSYEAAKYAVTHWHYSHTMPKSKLAKLGVWEDGKFIGAVVFGVGATYTIGEPYDLEQVEVCELVRVALTSHKSFTSKIITLSVKMLKMSNPGLRLVVSYADSKEGHHGGIYQAANWIFVGGSEDSYIRVNGELKHRRSLTLLYGTNSIKWLQEHVDPKAERVNMPPKWKYLMPLDNAMRRKIEPLRKPYPKKETCGQGVNGDTRRTNAEGVVQSHVPASDCDLG